MSIDLTCEAGIPLNRVPDLPWIRGRGDRRLHAATVHYWCAKGIRGRRLEFVQRGGTRVTTEAALLRFFQGLTEDQLASPPSHKARIRNAPPNYIIAPNGKLPS